MFNFAQLALPLIQAPMAGGITTPQLVAAVANHGGVGSFGFAYSTPEKIYADLVAAQSLSSGPINANFFVFSPVHLPSDQIQTNAMQALRSLGVDGVQSLTIPAEPFYPNLMEQLEPVWRARPAILSFHFGLPPDGVIAKAHALGIAVGISATSVMEGLAIESAHADFIVAQGIEAGGHRGQFDLQAEDEALSTLALTAQLAKHCRAPIVAAGGIMNGAHIQTALAKGAQAVQMGTAFLCCDESGTPPSYRHYVLHKQDRPTTLTNAFSGRQARGLENTFTRTMQNQTTLPFPIQNTLTGPLRQWAVAQNDAEYQSLWAGTAYAQARSMSTKDLMQQLRNEIEAEQ
ncbi:MAG: NAD(P)H-dependent flavin oxidoreductase [Polynucleobacter sp.]